MNNELIYPTKSIKSIMNIFSSFPPPINWRVKEADKISDFFWDFIIILDDDRHITIQRDPDPRYNKVNGVINMKEFLSHYPIAMNKYGNNLDWVHRFSDRINWMIPCGKIMVDNDKEFGPNGVLWLKNSIYLVGGISKSWLHEQFNLYLNSMELIKNYHLAEPNSPIMEGKWI